MLKFVTLTGLFVFLTQMVSATDILLSTDVPLSSVTSLSSQGYRNDIDILISALKNAYGGKDILPQNQYLELITGIENLKLNSNIKSSEQLCNKIANLTEKVNDYHLTIHIENKTCQRKWPQANVGLNSGYKNPNSTWSLSVKEFDNKTVTVLSIKKMSPSASPEWNGFLEAVNDLIKTKKSFVIDLRGNPGGDLTKGLQMAALLYGVHSFEDVPMPKKQVYRRQTPEAWAILANIFWLNMQTFKENKKDIPSYLNDNYQAFTQYHDKALQKLIPDLEIESLGQKKMELTSAVDFPIYVLIDRNCGSSCELTLEALEGLPMIQTIGENTTGVVQYGNVGALYLPFSHIIIRMPIQGAKYEDQRQIEKIGYAPKWRVPVGTDALEYTQKIFFTY